MVDRLKGSSTTWLTCDEIAFIQRIGTHTEHGLKTPPVTHLQRYLEGAQWRQEWGKIDKAAVVKEATRLLRAELRKVSRGKAA